MTATVATRLAPIHETRQVGWTTDRQTGLPKPVETVFIVGHGQQLARKREETRFAELRDRHAGQGVGDLHTRQQTRSVTLKARKAVEKDRQREAVAAELKAFRGNPGVISSRDAVARRIARRKAANAARANTSPFKHMHRTARIYAEAAAAHSDAPAKPKRVRKAAV